MKKLEKLVFVRTENGLELCKQKEPMFEDFNFVWHHDNGKNYVLDTSEEWWLELTDNQESELQNKILLESMGGLIYKVELVIDRENLNCKLIVHQIELKMGAVIYAYGYQTLIGMELPHFRKDKCCYEFNVGSGYYVEFRDEESEEPIFASIPLEIQKLVAETVKELHDLAKEDPDSFVSCFSIDNYVGLDRAKLMTEYPAFFKD